MNLKKCLLSISLVFFTSALFAKTDRWYRVEVLVFETKNGSANSEQWPTEPGKPNIKDAINIENGVAGYTLLPENKFALNSAKKKIQKNYNLLLHKGWRQKIDSKEQAYKVHVFGGHQTENGPFEVDGTVRLTSGRFLHADTDLLFSKENHTVRLKDSSRLRVKEVQYIDHPMYGVIIMVTPENEEKAAG